MPMVSATDIPLTPYPTGRTSPQAPSDYQQIPTSPQMFGSIGAEALQQAGQQGEKLATEVARIGAYQQHYLDRTEEDKLSSQLDDAAHQRKYGDPTAGLDANGNPLVPGFKNRYGSDAIDYIKSGQPSKDFNDDVARIAASASNDRVREMFLRQSRARRTAFDTSLDEHWTSQLAVHAQDVQKATVGGLARDLAAGYNNDAEVNDTINKMTRAYVSQETDPVIRQERFNQAVTDGAGQAIQGALGAGKAQRANQIYQAYKGYMTGTDQDKFNTRIQAHLNQQIGDDGYARASRPGGGGGGADAAQTAQRIAKVWKEEFGWTDAAIVGGLAGGALPESKMTIWNNPGSAGEMGLFQFHPGTHLPKFTGASPGDITPEAQARYVGNWMKANVPGYAANTDRTAATDQFHDKFEAPKLNSRQAPRHGYIPAAENLLRSSPAAPAGATPVATAPAAPAPDAAPATSVEGNLIIPPASPAAPGATTGAPATSVPGGTNGIVPAGAPVVARAVPGTASRLVFYGDSVANGTRSAMKAPGNTKDGRQPSEVLSNIGGTKLQGETAVISSGITNSRDAWRTDLPLVPKQIVAARDAGAGKVVLYGVGEGVKDNGAINAELQKIAAANNAVFVPLIGTGAYSDAKGAHAAGWHPRDYAGQGQYTIGQLGGSPVPTVGGAARPARRAVLPPGMTDAGNI